MPPEVHGEVSLACRYCRPPRGKTRSQRHLSRQKDIRKVQKHIARAVKYQANREGG